MINVYYKIELLPKLPALIFLSRSPSTIANFPKCPSLEISQKLALPLQTGWMEVANWGRKTFLRNCTPKFLQSLQLNFFNQNLHRHFVTSAELFASSILRLATRIGTFRPPLRQNFLDWMSRPLIQNCCFRNFLHVFYHCLN